MAKEEFIEKPELTITLNEYLSTFSPNHKLDTIIGKWHFNKDKSNSKKTKAEWDNVMRSFLGETER